MIILVLSWKFFINTLKKPKENWSLFLLSARILTYGVSLNCLNLLQNYDKSKARSCYILQGDLFRTTNIPKKSPYLPDIHAFKTLAFADRFRISNQSVHSTKVEGTRLWEFTWSLSHIILYTSIKSHHKFLSSKGQKSKPIQSLPLNQACVSIFWEKRWWDRIEGLV